MQAIDPQYYSDFVNVLLPKKAGITDWAQLKGKPLCATSGAWYNKDVARTYGAEIVAFDGSEKPLFALKQGNCVGYVYDQSMLQGKLLDDDWKADYALPLKGILDAPWMMAVAQGNTTLQTDGRGRDQGLDEDRLHRRRARRSGASSRPTTRRRCTRSTRTRPTDARPCTTAPASRPR